jgi:hypothetical protein
VKKYTKPGTAAQRAFSANAGKNVTIEYLNAAYSAPLINQVRLVYLAAALPRCGVCVVASTATAGALNHAIAA